MKDELTRLSKVTAVILVWLRKARRYSVMIFVACVLVVYGALLFRIHSLNATQPTADQINSQVKAARVPHIDQTVVRQLQSLEDNSVNVQALFDQARSNPFQ